MSTIIYPSPIFGPVHSRRLGLSLGINLMPSDGKLCTFDCIYCECGFNGQHRPTLPRPTREEVAKALKEKLLVMQAEGRMPDVLTFAGNGEPTAHPKFAEIIDDTIMLRDQFCPEAKVSVLSNATMLHRPDVFDALMRIDNNIQKLDTVDPWFINEVDVPQSSHYDVEKIIGQLEQFYGNVIIQTIFLKGDIPSCSIGIGSKQTKHIDNTTDYYIIPWLGALRRIMPRQVMIYTIDRETPTQGLQKATHEELDRIHDMVIKAGFDCTVSY